MNWHPIKFGDFVDFNPKIKLDKQSEYCFLPMEDVEPLRKYATSEFKRAFTGGGSRFQNGDTIFARITPCLEHGKIAKIRDLSTNVGFGSTEYFVFRGIPDISDPDYVYYLAKSNVITQPAIKSMTGSSGRQRADSDVVKNLVIKAPKIKEQRKIAAILNNYDGLIDNNIKRIGLLEESARQLYKEWFVRLRFPGYEHTKITKGVSEGWEKGRAYDYMDVLSGGTPKTGIAEYWGGEIPFYTPKDSIDSFYVIDTEKTLTEAGVSRCNSKLYPKNTIFITARGTVGNLNLAQRPMAMNQSCYALKGKENISQLFLFCAIDSAIAEFKHRASGAVFDAIIVDTFKLIPFLKPEKKLIKLFEEMVEPFFAQIENLLLQNIKVRQARDLLLPKLMSGEIAV